MTSFLRDEITDFSSLALRWFQGALEKKELFSEPMTLQTFKQLAPASHCIFTKFRRRILIYLAVYAGLTSKSNVSFGVISTWKLTQRLAMQSTNRECQVPELDRGALSCV